MSETRVNEPLSLAALVLLIWLFPHPLLYAVCVVCAFTLAIRWDAWYFGLLGAYSAGMVAVHIYPNPYEGYASEDQLVVLKTGITIIVVIWLAIRLLPGKDTRAGGNTAVHIPPRTLLTVQWFCLISGVIADASRYANGIPLFSADVDVTRQYARDQSNIITGFLHEGWTIGVMVTLASLLVDRRGPRSPKVVWLAVFVLGAFAGASRNALLIAALPAILVSLHFRSSAARAGAGDKVRKPDDFLKRILLASGVGVLIAGMMWFAGRRISDGVGAYERAFQRQFGDDPFAATLGALDNALSGSFETLSRLVAFGVGNHVPQYTIFQSFGAITRWAGYEPDLYSVTLSVSAPFHMNTATYLAAPIVDFGITGGIVASFALGLLFGCVDRWLRNDPTLAGQLIRYYVVYIAIFSIYEFIPFVQPAWIPVIGALVYMRRVSQRESTSDLSLQQSTGVSSK